MSEISRRSKLFPVNCLLPDGLRPVTEGDVGDATGKNFAVLVGGPGVARSLLTED